jgi:hypothetical protein
MSYKIKSGKKTILKNLLYGEITCKKISPAAKLLYLIAKMPKCTLKTIKDAIYIVFL